MLNIQIQKLIIVKQLHLFLNMEWSIINSTGEILLLQLEFKFYFLLNSEHVHIHIHE